MAPATRREWSFLAAGGVLIALALALAVPRYEIRPAGGTLAFLRIDRWTGSIERCSSTCRAVDDAKPESLDTGGFTEVKP